MKKNGLLFALIILAFSLNAQDLHKIKVASFNVRNDNSYDEAAGNGWKHRCPVVASMILFHDLDIIGTQECKNNQVEELDERLDNYSYIGRGRGETPTEDEYSAIYYKTDRFKLIKNGDFWLSQTPNVPSLGWDANQNRICTWGEFEEIATGFRFYAFNLHLDHVGVEARKNSAELLLQKMKEIAGDAAAFSTGDFNFDQYTTNYKIINSSGFLLDSYLLAPIRHDMNGTLNEFNVTTLTNRRIDHVFVTSEFTPLRYGVLTEMYWTDKEGQIARPEAFPDETVVVEAVPRSPSDHYPIVVELQYMADKGLVRK